MLQNLFSIHVSIQKSLQLNFENAFKLAIAWSSVRITPFMFICQWKEFPSRRNLSYVYDMLQNEVS